MVFKRRREGNGFDKAAAEKALTVFWGPGNGSMDSMGVCEAAIRAGHPSKQDLFGLRSSLNTSATGLTGERIQRADRMLKRLIHEQSA